MHLVDSECTYDAQYGTQLLLHGEYEHNVQQ